MGKINSKKVRKQIPGLGRSPGEGSGNLLKYSCLENPMDREPGGLQSMGLQRVKHGCVTNTHTHTHKKTEGEEKKIYHKIT